MMRTGLVGKLCACAASRAQAPGTQERSIALTRAAHCPAPSDRCRHRILDTAMTDLPRLRQAANTVHAAHSNRRTPRWSSCRRIFPDGLSKRVVKGHLLYAPVVTVVPGKLVFLSGILSRNSNGEIVGKGDMRAQIRQVFSNITDRARGRRRDLGRRGEAADLHHRHRRLFREHRRADGILRRRPFDQHGGRGAAALASGFSGRGRGDGRHQGVTRRRASRNGIAPATRPSVAQSTAIMLIGIGVPSASKP